MIRTLFVVSGLALAVACGAASAEAPGKEWKKCKATSSPSEVFYFSPGDENDIAVVLTYGQTCQGPKKAVKTFYRKGVWTMKDGQYTDSPNQYDRIVPLSRDDSFVLREDGRWATYRLGVGELASAPLHADVRHLEPLLNCPMPKGRKNTLPRAVVSLGAVDAQGRREGAIYSVGKPPAVLKGLGGPGIEEPFIQHDNMIVARWIDAAGIERSRIYNLAGEPLSPVVGKVERWGLRALAEENYKVCNFTEELNLFVAGPSLDRDPKDDFFGRLLTPIGSNGAPVTLPAGAAGVFPVLSRPYSEVMARSVGWQSTLAWAVVYPTAEGFEFTMSGGSLAQAIADAPTGIRYEEIVRLGDGWDEFNRYTYSKHASIIARSPDGKWRGRSYIKFHAVGAPADTEEAADKNAEYAFRDAQFAERAAEVAKGGQMYMAALDAGGGCNLPAPLWLDRPVVERHARACPEKYGLTERNWLRNMGYPADILRGVDLAQSLADRKAAADHAKMLANTAAYVPPGSWETALRLGGDAWVKQIQGRGESWLIQRQQEYLADWNRAQRAY